MLSPANISLFVSKEARDRIKLGIEQISSFKAIAGLLLAEPTADRPDRHWIVGYYDRQVVEGPHFLGKLIVSNEIELVVPQVHLISGLDGQTLHWDGSQFVVIGTSQKA